MQVDFYQVGRTPPARVLAQIAARVLAGGGRLLVVGDDPAALDRALWDGEDSFLPHGIATADDPGADQPVLIAPACEAAANGARNVALADGAWRDAALGFDRVFLLFGEEGVAAAREAWRGLAQAADATRNYWSQDEDGRWAKRA